MARFLIAILAGLPLVATCSEPRPATSRSDRPEAEPAEAEEAPAEDEKEKPEVSNKIANAFPPQVAGGFYTDVPERLRREVRGYLDAAGPSPVPADRDIVGILSPHAGYPYSGPVAGKAYAAVSGRGYRTVFVMALCHRGTARRAALIDRPAYDTPLGSLEVDGKLVRRLLADHPDLFEVNERLFSGEHSLEVELPFIQLALPEARVVPMIVAVHDEAFVERLGRALFEAVGERGDVLFAISSDLSHFFPYEQAVQLDEKNLSLLEQWKLDDWKAHASQSREGMCGFLPLYAFARLFEGFPQDRRQVTRIDYKNSGDTAGDRSRVVGYGSLAFTVDQGLRDEQGERADFGPYGPRARRALMEIAKRSVAAAVRGESYTPDPPQGLLAEDGAAFVTLKQRGRLRGCIGHVIARVPLFRCVTDVARSAAIHDTRFRPVTEAELADLTYEISVLTAPEPTTPEQVVVGRDGLIMSSGCRSGLLLPQVPLEWGWDRDEFLEHTCRKAGLPVGCWKDPATRIESFRAIVWGEDDLDD
ncbi:MAG: AmmeMemoRadiSam system protein B [Deltaproteobacteria bacterium]|nr:AmmeMemoRadiSam system protein B [Deltaproteobacteria bacterium]